MGVGVSWTEKGKTLRLGRCTRMAIGILSYPFATTRIFAWGMEFIIGDRKYEANPLYWGSVI